MNKQLATQEQIAIDDVKRLANIVLALRNDVFKEGVDYGKIPGTNDKPTLLLPGMEKLLRALRLRPEYVERSKVEDFEKGIIYYRYECRLIDYETGHCVATAIGSANSYESKWHWREQKRTCPKCGKEAINRSRFPPKGSPQGTEPGWYCFAKIGGCGAEFSANDHTIINQQVGRIENPDIFDQMNTIDKIAQKRSLGSAIKGAANVSEMFTVDLEDFQHYDTTPIVIQKDDGRKVEAATGEIVEEKQQVVTKVIETPVGTWAVPTESVATSNPLDDVGSEPDTFAETFARASDESMTVTPLQQPEQHKPRGLKDFEERQARALATNRVRPGRASQFNHEEWDKFLTTWGKTPADFDGFPDFQRQLEAYVATLQQVSA